MKPLVCPFCGGSEFEERGDVRCYSPGRLTVGADGALSFEADTFSTPMETYDRDDVAVYCVGCDAEFFDDDLVSLEAWAAAAEGAGAAGSVRP